MKTKEQILESLNNLEPINEDRKLMKMYMAYIHAQLQASVDDAVKMAEEAIKDDEGVVDRKILASAVKSYSKKIASLSI